MRQDEKVAWHRRVRDAAQAREMKAKQLAQALETQAKGSSEGSGSGSGGGSRATVSEAADAWVQNGASQLAETLPRHDHIVLMAVTHAESMKTGVSSVVKCDCMTALLALGRLVNQINEAMRRDHMNIQVELRTRPIRSKRNPNFTPRGLPE